MIKEVIIVSKTHLDIGFTDLAQNVKKRYVEQFLDKALKLSEHYREAGNGRNYCWTVGSWLIYELLNELPAKDRDRLEAAIKRGDLVWHAMPFTMHCELNTEFLFRRALDISKTLDERFGRQTIAAKFTDVPGHTRGIVAPMADSGVKLLHIGINPASAAVELPDAFNWLDSGGNSLMVIYQKDYGEEYLLPDNETLLCMDVSGDNTGPGTLEAVDKLYDSLKIKYPDAKIRCGELNQVAEKMLPFKDKLPVVNGEIGDTWVHGMGTDPYKVACFRELCRWRETYGKDPSFDRFDFELLQISEHTWGMDEKTHLADRDAYLGYDLKNLHTSDKGKLFASSWNEQRQILNSALNFLDDTLKVEASEVLGKCTAAEPFSSGFEQYQNLEFETPHFSGSFYQNGSISELTAKGTGLLIADDKHHLFSFSGEIFGSEDYDRFFSQYNRLDEQWAIDDFTKPGTPECIKHKVFSPILNSIQYKQTECEDIYLLRLNMPSSDKTGMPETIYLEYEFSKNEPCIQLTLSWFNKFPARIAHAVNLACKPTLSNPEWSISKLGEHIDISKIESKGARCLHAVDDNIICQNTDGKLIFNNCHSPLVSLGKTKLLNFDNELPNMKEGISYNLYNNIWGTNFPMWYSDNAKFKFMLNVNSN